MLDGVNAVSFRQCLSQADKNCHLVAIGLLDTQFLDPVAKLAKGQAQ
jgi:hypothetical protein